MRVGVISDTHGLLRPAALDLLRGCNHILHAGDVGDAEILDALRSVAPLTAIRGNIDRIGPCAELPATEYLQLAGKAIYMVHDVNDLDIVPNKAGVAAVVSGHSHKPTIEWRGGVLYFNPGSAGPRRFSLPVCVGFLSLDPKGLQPEILRLV